MYTQQHDLSIGVLPPEVLCKFRKHEIVIIATLCELWNLHRINSPNDTIKCWPGEQYLADKAGVTKWTISRSIRRLIKMGIIQAFQRRTRIKIWRTNMYYIGRILLKAIKAHRHRAIVYVETRLRQGASNLSNFIKRIEKEETVDNFRGRKFAFY